MDEPDLLQQARIFLPKYLSPEQQRDLWEELRSFPSNRSYYTSDPALSYQLMQGDGWRGFVVVNFFTLEKKQVSGVIISNSCDIAVDNDRAMPPNILFAPMVRLDAYCALLAQAGKTPAQIESIRDSIRNQRHTSIFYLRADGEALPESLIVLDDIHAHPLRDFVAGQSSCVFTLNVFAWYLFLLKLSIHLLRMQEGIARR